MAEPKRKTSRARRDNRRSHHALNKTLNVMKCEKCGTIVKPHTICDNCGTYAGKRRKPAKKVDTKSEK